MSVICNLRRAHRVPERRLVPLSSLLVLSLTVMACSPEASSPVAACRASVDAPTVARMWNERALDAIRRDVPDPTVAARNLFHLSVAMWDVFVLTEAGGRPIYVDDSLQASLTPSERDSAISVAAYVVLSSRYDSDSTTDRAARLRFDQSLRSVCLPERSMWDHADPTIAVGLKVANAVLEAARQDKSNEPVTYVPANEPLIVRSPGTSMVEPQRWQPLSIEGRTTQTGVLQPDIQEILGGGWGNVSGFSLDSYADVASLVPEPPAFGSREFNEAIVEVLDASRRLQLSDSRIIDVSPVALGNNPLGTQEGTGYQRNPTTGQPYTPLLAFEADYGRVIADYWADGPGSETPPGHWNVLANKVSDLLADKPETSTGNPILDPSDRLRWDLALYVLLNAALHDAAIAAWGAKTAFDYARPISMIRYAGMFRQASDSRLPNFHPNGLMLTPDVSEIITSETAHVGGHHGHLRDHIHEVAVKSWIPGEAHEEGHIGWALAANWLPFQLPTFVTPAFPGYVSGHSTFSRAAAEVLAYFTGSPYFPGGLHEIVVREIDFAPDPRSPMIIQWATYFDAADQAGDSRIWGGIHVRADDFAGRILGAEIGRRVIDRFITEYLVLAD